MFVMNKFFQQTTEKEFLIGENFLPGKCKKKKKKNWIWCLDVLLYFNPKHLFINISVT